MTWNNNFNKSNNKENIASCARLPKNICLQSSSWKLQGTPRMGCVSSKRLETVLKAEGFDTVSNRKNNHHHHDVALTSTTYGILNSESLRPDIQQEQHRGKSYDSSTNQVYEKLKSFELSTESGPQSWSEVSRVLENFKPGLEKKNPERKDGEFDTVESWDVMDVDEIDQPGKISVGRKKKHFDNRNISYHTVEELDAKLGACSKSSEEKIGSKSEKAAGVGKISNGDEEFNLQKGDLQKNSSAHLAPRQERRMNFQGSNLDLSGDGGRADSQFNLRNTDVLLEPSSPLFDPELLASFEKALKNLSEDDWNAVRNKESDEGKSGLPVGTPSKSLVYVAGGKIAEVADKKENGSSHKIVSPASPMVRQKINPLNGFEEKCPSGGEKAVVLYTTTLRGIRKTFEDCNNVRSVLESFGVSIDERDVSMHLEFRNELRELMGKPMPVPRLFIKGRHIGGVDEVLHLHEEDKLAELLRGMSTNMAGKTCDGCGGMRFVPCLECSGSCKLVNDENMVVRCPDCNENGLIQCPICC